MCWTLNPGLDISPELDILRVGGRGHLQYQLQVVGAPSVR